MGLVLAIVVLPLLNYASSAVVSLSQQASQGLSDNIYKSAARGLRKNGDVLFMGMLGTVIFVGGLFYILLALGPGSAFYNAVGRVLIRIRRVTFLLNVILVPTLGLVLMGGALTLNIEDRLIASFRQRLVILGPHLTEREEKELAARWASMKTRADYDALNRQLSEFAKARGVDLPVPPY